MNVTEPDKDDPCPREQPTRMSVLESLLTFHADMRAERPAERHNQALAARNAGRQVQKQAERQAEKPAVGLAGRQTLEQAARLAELQTDIYADRHADR